MHQKRLRFFILLRSIRERTKRINCTNVQIPVCVVDIILIIGSAIILLLIGVSPQGPLPPYTAAISRYAMKFHLSKPKLTNPQTPGKIIDMIIPQVPSTELADQYFIVVIERFAADILIIMHNYGAIPYYYPIGY